MKSVQLTHHANGLVTGEYDGLRLTLDPRDGEILASESDRGGWDTDMYLFVRGQIIDQALAHTNPTLLREYHQSQLDAVRISFMQSFAPGRSNTAARRERATVRVSSSIPNLMLLFVGLLALGLSVLFIGSYIPDT